MHGFKRSFYSSADFSLHLLGGALLMVGGALLMVGGAEVEVERYGRLSAELAPSTSRDTNCSLRQTHTSS